MRVQLTPTASTLNRFSFFIVAFSFAMLLFAGCKKNDNDSQSDEYYIRFKANGDTKNLTTSLTANKIAIPTLYTINFAGGSNDLVTQGSVGFGVAASTELMTGVKYSNSIANRYSGMNYTIDGKTYVKLTDMNTNIFEVTFTEVTSEHIKGNFSGKLDLAAGTSTTKVLTITEGEFYIKF